MGFDNGPVTWWHDIVNLPMLEIGRPEIRLKHTTFSYGEVISALLPVKGYIVPYVWSGGSLHLQPHSQMDIPSFSLNVFWGGSVPPNSSAI